MDQSLTQTEQQKLASSIEEARALRTINGQSPVVFMASTTAGRKHIGVCFQPAGTQAGERFHYDHGAGIEKNQDAVVVWASVPAGRA